MQSDMSRHSDTHFNATRMTAVSHMHSIDRQHIDIHGQPSMHPYPLWVTCSRAVVTSIRSSVFITKRCRLVECTSSVHTGMRMHIRLVSGMHATNSLSFKLEVHTRHVSEHLLCCTFISCVSCDEPNAVPAYVALHRSLVLFPLATADAAGGIARTVHTTLTIVHPFMTSHGWTIIIACMQCGPRDAGCSRVHCHTPS